jgi:hypothetical protein
MHKHTIGEQDQLSGGQGNEAAIRLLAQWLEEDRHASAADEESWERLKAELDRDRLSRRPLFP